MRKYAVAVLAAIVVLFGASLMVAHADTQGGTGAFIGSGGNAFVHGATVTATSTTGLTAVTNLGGNTITWNVLASSTTRFGKLGQGLSALANVAIGDIVSFFGKFSGSGSTLTVEANALKDRTFVVAHASSTKEHGDKNDKDNDDHKGNHGLHKGWFLGLRTHGFFHFDK